MVRIFYVRLSVSIAYTMSCTRGRWLLLDWRFANRHRLLGRLLRLEDSFLLFDEAFMGPFK
jgi:hypothetical protein